MERLTNPGDRTTKPRTDKSSKLAKKGSKQIYSFLRANINRGNLTRQSEDSVNRMLGQIQTIQFFNNMYKNTSKIRCNPKLKYQEQIIGMNRQTLNKPLSKYPKLRIEADCTFCTIRNVQPRPQETPQHFYSERIYVQRLWTDIRDWAT